MMCPGISYSTVHSLMFHTNGSVQNNKLFKEFCNKKQAHFMFWSNPNGITESMIDNETLTLLDQPDKLKYDDMFSSLISEYEIMTTFMEINRVSATWESYSFSYTHRNSSYQLEVGAYWCMENAGFECCPPM